MEFERLVSSLDAEGLAQAAEALLRALSGGTPGGGPSLPGFGAWQGSRRAASLPLSAAEAAGPLPGAGGGRRDAAAAAEALPAFPDGEAAGTAQAEKRPDPDAERKPRALATADEELTRLSERLAAVSERNLRVFGAEAGAGAGAGTIPPFRSADDPAATGAAAAGAEPSPALSAARFGGLGAAAPGEAETVSASRAAGAAARDFFDAEAVSEFFRRDSRRYDSGSSDQREAWL